VIPVTYSGRFGVKYTDPKYTLTKGSKAAAAYDLKARTIQHWLAPGERQVIPTGVFLELPEGFHALVLPRSGNAAKAGLTVLNAPGLIDEDYRGEIGVILINLGRESVWIQDGDKIAQLLIQPTLSVPLTEIQDLSETERGTKGFGSSGVVGEIVCPAIPVIPVIPVKESE
jgi:dUTP pyrophosphatase